MVIFTDGSIRSRKGVPHGGYGSITLFNLPGWAHSTVRVRPPGFPSFPLNVGRRLASFRTLGDEPVAVDTMELAALLDAALHAPLVNVVVFVDPTYITKNLPAMSSLSPFRWTRFSNCHIWRKLLAAIAHRHSLGLSFIVLKCSAHGVDPTQHPTFPLATV